MERPFDIDAPAVGKNVGDGAGFAGGSGFVGCDNGGKGSGVERFETGEKQKTAVMPDLEFRIGCRAVMG